MDDGAMPEAECTVCKGMFTLDLLSAHEENCTRVPDNMEDDVPCAKKKKVQFGTIKEEDQHMLEEYNVRKAKGDPAYQSISGGNDPTALPTSYQIRSKFKNRVQVKDSHVGLLNQGATCYMNSLLQTLFMSADFRQNILKWEIPEEMRTDLNVPYQLQLLFMRMGYSTKSAVETKALTKSFRWTSSHHFAQHDVQELNRVLFEALQKYVDHLNTGNNFLVRLFEGTLSDYIECKVCGERRERVDTFQDVTVTVKDTTSLEEALEKFVEVEEMTGGNSIFCDKCAKNQDSMKGLRFKTLPPILTVQMRRFDFDFTTLKREKVYDDVQIPHVLNLSHHVPSPSLSDFTQLTYLCLCLGRRNIRLPTDILNVLHSFLDHHTYELFSVLAHRGTTSSGHYIAYIRELQEGKRDWYCFNDEWVTKAEEDALKECLDPTAWQEQFSVAKAASQGEQSAAGPLVAVEYNWKSMGNEIPQAKIKEGGGVVIVDSIEKCPLNLNDVVLTVDGAEINKEEEWYEAVAHDCLHQVKVRRAPPATNTEPVVGEVCVPTAPCAPAPTAPLPREDSDGSVDCSMYFPFNDDNAATGVPIFHEYGPSPSPAMMNAAQSLNNNHYNSKLPGVTSRMYPYMAVYRLRGSSQTEQVLRTLPEYLRTTVESEAGEFQEMVSKYDEVKDLVELKLCNPTKWVTVLKGDTVWEATIKCAEALDMDITTLSPDKIRLRYYTESKGVAGKTINFNVTKALVEDTRLAPLTAVVLETREDSDPEFGELEEDIKVFLSVYSPEEAFRTERQCIVLQGYAKLYEMVVQICKLTGIGLNKLVVTKTRGAHTPVVLFEPGMEKVEKGQAFLLASIDLTHDISCSDVIFVESADYAADVTDPALIRQCGNIPPSPYRAVNEVNSRKLCTVKYTLPGDLVPLQNILRTPLLTPTKDLRQLIASAHDFDPGTFILRDASAPTGRVLKVPEKPIQAYAHTTLECTKEVKVTVIEEAPLDEDEMAVEVYVLKKKPGNATFVCKMVAKSTALLADFKKAMAQKEEVSSLGITEENMRVRKMEKDKKNRFEKALLEQTWKECIPVQLERINVVIEKGVEGEKLAKMSLFLVVQRYYPKTDTYSETEELVISKRTTATELQRKIAELHGIENHTEVRVAKVHLKVPAEGADRASNKKVFWRHTEPPENGEDSRPVLGAPFKFEQDCLIAFKHTADDPDEAPATTVEPSAPLLELINNKPTMDNITPLRPVKPEQNVSRERGIVIRTEWDPVSPVDQGLNPPEEERATDNTDQNFGDNCIDNDHHAALLGLDNSEPDNHHHHPGDSASFIEELGPQPYTDMIMELTSNPDCCICLGQFTKDDMVVALNCMHVHHAACLGQWVEQKATCPTCNVFITGPLI
eukprot:TRINITY_DN1221_c2_g1_i1.p1 TRINITY_DN1221_c2_g1~~TRINITY_DN1221_c2_g1_i1.p1  ORF type:complete len:1383 (+),score=340.81 TRINITY_DN1221_c2_g1_i1:127-4275(+)